MAIPTLQTIEIKRGDSQDITLSIVSGLELVDGDTLYFEIKKKPTLEAETIYSAEFTSGGTDFEVSLTSEDTKIELSTYYYQYRVKKADGDVMTLCNPSKLLISEVIFDV